MWKAAIVDDESATRDGLLKYVPWRELGVHEVCAAEDAESMLALCRRMHPDIVISDIRMPGMDGIELCKRLREMLPLCRIIFLSGYADKEYLMAAIELSAVSYIEKPVDIARLSQAITRAVSECEALMGRAGDDEEAERGAEATAAYSSCVRRVIRLMEAGLTDEALGLDKLAKKVYLTPSYLANVFKREVGVTVGQYLLDLRMRRAQALLRDRGLKLYQVAQMSGYADANYFAKAFKKVVGASPKEYREKMVP